MLRRLPWMTTALAIVLAINPIGLSFLDSAFVSNEALSRNIARPLVFAAIVALLALGLLEWWIGTLIRRRAGQAPLDPPRRPVGHE